MSVKLLNEHHLEFARIHILLMAFRWQADDGPFILVTKLSRFIALTKLSRSAHGACFLIILNE